MKLEILKQQIISLVNSCTNEAQLQDVMDLLSINLLAKKDKESTEASMLISEKSLAKAWENEDDEHWNAFLRD